MPTKPEITRTCPSCSFILPFFVLERNCIKILNGSISIYHWCRLWFVLSSRWGLRCAPDPLPLTHNGWGTRDWKHASKEARSKQASFALKQVKPSIRSFLHGNSRASKPQIILCFNVKRQAKQASREASSEQAITSYSARSREASKQASKQAWSNANQEITRSFHIVCKL